MNFDDIIKAKDKVKSTFKSVLNIELCDKLDVNTLPPLTSSDVVISSQTRQKYNHNSKMYNIKNEYYNRTKMLLLLKRTYNIDKFSTEFEVSIKGNVYEFSLSYDRVLDHKVSAKLIKEFADINAECYEADDKKYFVSGYITTFSKLTDYIKYINRIKELSKQIEN